MRCLLVDVDILFKIAGIGIVVSILSKVLDEAGRKEQAQMTTLVGVVVVLMMVIQLVAELFSKVKTMFQLY
jgi:stage III sporulation protein AC